MKTIKLFITLLFVTVIATSQNNVAYTNVSILKNNSKSINSSYLAITKKKNVAEGIKDLQKMAAEYKLSDQDIYNSKDPSIYTVEFKSDLNKLVVQYNQNNEILSTIETYENSKIPSSIQEKIAKTYPGWQATKNILKVKYTKNRNDLEYSYTVTLSKNNITKTLKF